MYLDVIAYGGFPDLKWRWCAGLKDGARATRGCPSTKSGLFSSFSPPLFHRFRQPFSTFGGEGSAGLLIHGCHWRTEGPALRSVRWGVPSLQCCYSSIEPFRFTFQCCDDFLDVQRSSFVPYYNGIILAAQLLKNTPSATSISFKENDHRSVSTPTGINAARISKDGVR
jgi:hypothetical protein